MNVIIFVVALLGLVGCGGEPTDSQVQEEQERSNVYRVIYSHQEADFSQRVEAAILDGWMLHGGVAATVTPDGSIRFYQAMTKWKVEG